MKNKKTKIAYGIILFCVMATLVAYGADLVGASWDGETRNSDYVIFAGDKGLFSGWNMVILHPFDGEAVWETDSTSSCSTGTWNISRWYGPATIHWKVTDTAATVDAQSQAYVIEFDVRNTIYDDWYAAWSATVTDDSVHSQYDDTLNFQDPLMRGRYARVKMTGSDGNIGIAKNAEFTLTVKFERTGTQFP